MNEDINGKQVQTQSQSSPPGKLPPLDHITTNIIPLSTIIHIHTQEAYKQFTTAIENLAVDQSNDIKRKKQFLELIISLRQDLIKLYTVVKWCSNSQDVSKLIDLLNYLRGLEFNYDQLVYTMNQEFGNSQFNYGTKLPNSDLITSLQVLYNQRPQLESYGYLQQSQEKLSNEKVLQVLQELNLILTVRFALMDQEELPVRVNINYQIKHGKCYITVPNEYQVVITTISETSPFYLIDFKFLFGINQETLTISHNISTKLPVKSYKKLEKIINNIFSSSKTALLEVYEVLHKYSMCFKLYLLAKQIKQLMVNSKWRNNIDLNYTIGRNNLIVNYWSSHYLSKSFKSFVELGIDRNYNLNYRWFKNGKYQQTDVSEIFSEQHPEEDDEEAIIDEEDDEQGHPHELNVDVMLNLIVNKHAELLMNKVYTKLSGLLTTEQITLVNSHQLLVKLSDSKSTIFAINPLTGYFYFIDPITIQQTITKKINTPPPQVNKQFISEDDLVKNIIDQIIQLRVLVYTKEINTKLITCQWINNDIPRPNEIEGNCQFYRVKKWPSSWFLITSINGINNKITWYVARIRSVKGEWKVQWMNQLFENEDVTLDYKFFSGLSTICSNMIIDHMIIQELKANKVKYLKVDKTKQDKVLSKFNSSSDSSDAVYQSLIMIYNDNLLPINNSSTSLLLQIQLLVDHKMRIKLLGNLRNVSIKSNDYHQLNLSIDDNCHFQFTDIILTTSLSNNLLDKLFNNLSQFNKLIKLLDQLNNNNIEIISNTINEITIKINLIELTIIIPEDATRCIQLTSSTTTTHLQLVLEYINRYLIQTKTTSIIGIIKYLQMINPVLQAIDNINTQVNQQHSHKLNNGLARLNFDVVFNTLDSIQFIFHISSTSTVNVKKIIKDKIIINLGFKFNKFNNENKRFLVKVSLVDNLIESNIKFKKLFELIFKNINEVNKREFVLYKLNYDFLVSVEIIQEMLEKIGASFIGYLSER
ncbi:Mediator of RNA polymerase II transcription subunit 14 [Spathaspora sp. JA1]|nr:Mediator of RNA polymerase II transcription subunit 14 [Spathaspora sp. JA1]